MKKVGFAALIALTAWANEPSAFGAGDLNSPDPYGLTPAEKKIYETDKSLQNISRTVLTAEQLQTELRTEVDGLKSILSGHDEKLREISGRLSGNDQSILKLQNDMNISISEIRSIVEQNFKLQNENYDKIMKAIGDLGAMIDKINEEYVAHSELKTMLGKNYKLPARANKAVDANISAVETPTASKPVVVAQAQSDDSAQKMTPETLFTAALENYKKNKLSDAKAKFLELTKSGYKKESVYYYLGECDYKSGNYKEALESFQVSIEADDKSQFVPIILFHTSICLEKLNDKDGAKKILSSLIENYPKHWLNAPAKKRLTEIR